MQQPVLNLPVFPLPVFLLPKGVTKLRVFEKRYLKMVSLASKGQGFVIWLKGQAIEQTPDNMQWGSWVEIINFDQGDDGVLEIDVMCKSLVMIKNMTTDTDNLHFGNVECTEHWSEMPNSVKNADLSTSLASVFKENENLNELYPQKILNNSHWVLARWLEILPIELNVKNAFVVSYTFKEAKEFVESVIFEK
jgi:hypothetical protein|tara:strand:- start:368 stop:946 length:579 start_codon:yes stop_codon:yes gene_type:complete